MKIVLTNGKRKTSMLTTLQTLEAEEWRFIAKYASGKADQISTILSLFETQLTPEIKNWLTTSRKLARDETGEALNKELKIYQQGGLV